MVSVLDLRSSNPGLSPGRGTALCSQVRHFSFKVPLSIEVYKYVLANLLLRVPTLQWTSILSRGSRNCCNYALSSSILQLNDIFFLSLLLNIFHPFPFSLHSYPSVVVVPQNISDDSILKIAKNHRQGRFPVAVWRHQRNKATLLRAGGIERSTIGSIMRQTKTVGGSSVASHAISSSASAEQEKYLAAVGEYS